MPAYNCVQLIPDAINSVLMQDFEDYELIICDNASTDNTEEIVDTYYDSRIRYSKNAYNIGFVNNLNKGLDLAIGEYIIFLCADDVWLQDILRKEVELLDQSPSVVFVHAGFKHIGQRSDKGKAVRQRWPKAISGVAFFRAYFKGYAPVCLSTSMARTNAMRQVGGFNADFSNAADFAMWLRLALEDDVAYLAEVLGAYRIHSSSLSNTTPVSDALSANNYDRILEWPLVRDKGLLDLKHEIPRMTAWRSIRMLHNLADRHAVLVSFRHAVAAYPPILLVPTVWLRLLFSLVIPNSIRTAILQIVDSVR